MSAAIDLCGPIRLRLSEKSFKDFILAEIYVYLFHCRGINFNQIDGKIDRRSLERDYVFESNGRPVNIVGRTGVTGRGMLGKWGPNHAADPVVTRWKRNAKGEVVRGASGKPIMEFVAIQRGDTKEWAIPGVILKIETF